MKLTKIIRAAVPVFVITGTCLLGAGAATASPGLTPNGYAGAQNMINTHAICSMFSAMGHANANGDNQMWNAVVISAGSNLVYPLPTPTC